MAFSLPSGSIMLLSIRGKCFGQRIIHVRTFRSFGNATISGSPQSLQSEFIDLVKPGAAKDMVTPYAKCLSENWQADEIRAQLIHPIRYAYTGVSINTEGEGGVANTANVNASITASTDRAGRGEVANYKIGPIGYANSAGGLLSNALLAKLNDYSQTFMTQVQIHGGNASLWFPCIFHRKKRQLPAPEYYSDIIDAAPFGETRVKVRRTVGRGK